jgi:hypothetical protein
MLLYGIQQATQKHCTGRHNLKTNVCDIYDTLQTVLQARLSFLAPVQLFAVTCFQNCDNKKGTLETIFRMSNQYEKQLTVGTNREYTLTGKRNREGRINVDVSNKRQSDRPLTGSDASETEHRLFWTGREFSRGRDLRWYAMGSYF